MGQVLHVKEGTDGDYYLDRKKAGHPEGIGTCSVNGEGTRSSLLCKGSPWSMEG